MAIAVTGVSTWFTRSPSTDISHVDMTTLENGRVVVALGGVSGGNAVVHTALVSPGLTVLGDLTTQSYGPAPGQQSAAREIEIDALAGGGFATTFVVNSSAIGPDTTYGGLFQLHAASGAAIGAALSLDAGALGNYMMDNPATVALSSGSTVVLSTAGSFAGTPDGGLKMDVFTPGGIRAGATATIIASVDLGLALRPGFESSPEIHDAVQMANGNLAFTYEQQVRVPNPVSSNFDTAEQRLFLQEIDEITGAKVGGPVQIVGPTGGASDITRLSDGRLLVVWQDATRDATRLKAQILSADGDTKLGAAFDISGYQTAAEFLGDVIALPNGGFAVSWFNGINHHLARMFTATGAGAGHDFLLTANGATYLLPSAGELALSGDTLVAMTTGLQMDQSEQKMYGQVWSTASTKGITRNGKATDDSLTGRAKDDRLTGNGGADVLDAKGGNDIVQGGIGADRLIGGAGRDVLVGGKGADRLAGGAGSDVFVFTAKDEGIDRISDFSRAEGDRLSFENMGFGTAFGPTILPLGISNITNDDSVGEAGFHFNTLTRLLSYDYDGASGAQARVDIAVLAGISSLQHGDFLIY